MRSAITQETLLGTYKGENVVVIQDFLGEDEVFVPFNGVGDSSLEQDKEKYQYSYEDITGMLQDNIKLTDVEQTIDLFWDMFIIDALIANFDRHGSNWGFVKRDNKYRLSTFIAERTPSENREDLWEILESVGLDYYDRFEWLLRTTMRSANDNLIVERRRDSEVVEEFTAGMLSAFQYGDKIVVDSMEAIADTTAGFTDGIFKVVTNGVDIVSSSGQVLVDAVTRAAMVPIVVTQRMITRREQAAKRRDGIEQAKKNGKYTGRKPIEVDEEVLRQVNQELKEGLITVEEAMRRTKIASKSTFYRKVKQV